MSMFNKPVSQRTHMDNRRLGEKYENPIGYHWLRHWPQFNGATLRKINGRAHIDFQIVMDGQVVAYLEVKYRAQDKYGNAQKSTQFDAQGHYIPVKKVEVAREIGKSEGVAVYAAYAYADKVLWWRLDDRGPMSVHYLKPSNYVNVKQDEPHHLLKRSGAREMPPLPTNETEQF